MQIFKVSLVFFVMIAGGCATTGKDVSMPLEGTNAAVVKISVDAVSGKPRVSEEFVKVARGQRVVWVGPDQFTIAFPKGSPFSESQFQTENSVINLIIPDSSAKRQGKGKESIFKYDVIANGKVLDPHLIIIEQ